MNALPGVSIAELALLKRILKKHLATLHPKVHAFGSRTTPNYRENSDLDLLIDAPAPLPLHTLAELREALEKSDLPFRVDLLEKRALPGHILRSIERCDTVLLEYG